MSNPAVSRPTPADVVRWRVERLVRHGFARGLARALAADPRYDLHAAIELVERGCPPELAARILAPLDDDHDRDLADDRH